MVWGCNGPRRGPPTLGWELLSACLEPEPEAAYQTIGGGGAPSKKQLQEVTCWCA